MNTTFQQQPIRPGWDKRAWKLSLVISLLLGAMIMTSILGPLANRVGDDNASGVGGVAMLLSIFVFPPILSGVARRRLLLGAYLPILVTFLWVIAGGIADAFGSWPETGDTGPEPTGHREVVLIWTVLAMCVVGPLVTAAPVCIFRVVRRRSRARQAASDAAMRQAMATPREGVWPPPPTEAGPPAPPDQGRTSWP